jgi:dTDP-4-dehydrorhamnose 3,5-epimerase
VNVTATEIPEVKIMTPRIFEDHRGYFFESYSQRSLESTLGSSVFCQDNESFSKRGVVRGLHYQLEPYAQTKLVRVISGAIWDVAVDLRRSSPTFKKWVGVELSADNKKQLLVPKGFGHGFVVLSETAVVQYKVDAFYSKEHDRGVRFDDPELGVSWPLKGEWITSEKDEVLPFLKGAELFK